jgi:hypothetical protein
MQTFAIYHLPLHNRKPGVDSEFEHGLESHVPMHLFCGVEVLIEPPRQAAAALAASTKAMGG